MCVTCVMYLVTRNWHVWELCVSCVHILKNLCTRVMYFEKSKVKLAFFTHIFYFSHMFLLSFGLFFVKTNQIGMETFQIRFYRPPCLCEAKKTHEHEKNSRKIQRKVLKKIPFWKLCTYRTSSKSQHMYMCIHNFFTCV